MINLNKMLVTGLCLLLGLSVTAAAGCGTGDSEIAGLPIYPTEGEIDTENMEQELVAKHRYEIIFDDDPADVVAWYAEKLSEKPGFKDRLILSEPCPESGVGPAVNPNPDNPFGSWIIEVDSSYIVITVSKHGSKTLVLYAPQ